MRSRLRNMRGTITSTFVLLLTISHMFLSQPLVSAVIGDLAQVSPGKIPPKEDNHYLGNSSFQVKLEYPRSFILQETVGDLHFVVSVSANRTRIDIYIPPEFGVISSKNYVWTNVTNNYGDIGISRTSVSVSNGTSGIGPGNYSVRVFDVTAPKVVGRYFFKVFTGGDSIGAMNFPSVVVSADPNPAYISGTVRYGGYLNASFYGSPIDELLSGDKGGKVQATGITPDGRIVLGQAFFNSTSSEYTLYGLAAGRYRLNATAAGFAPAELAYEIALKPGQSMEGVDIFVKRSPILSVVALSRWRKQAWPWGKVTINGTKEESRTITLEILDMWNSTVALLNETASHDQITHEFKPYNGSRDLDGHIPQEKEGFVAGIAPGRYYVRVWTNAYVQVGAKNEWALTSDCAVVFTQEEENRKIDIQLERTGILNVTVHFRDSTPIHVSPIPFDGTLTVKAYDINEVVRASNSARVQKGDTSASVELTGVVGTRGYGIPQGVYKIEATLTGYVQPSEHKAIIGEGVGNTSFYMLLLGRLNVTVFSASWQRPFSLIPWRYPNSRIAVEIRDAYGVERYEEVRGKQLSGESAVKLENVTGLDDGTYSIHVFTYGYVQRQDVFFSVKRGETADISVVMTIGVQIEVTVVFEKQRIISRIDTYTKYWNPDDPKVPVRFEVYDSKAQFVAANITYVLNANTIATCNVVLAGFKQYHGNAAMRWVNYYDTTDGTSHRDYGLERDLYTIKVFVPGYHQPIEPTVDARTSSIVSVVLALHRMGRLYGMIHTYNTLFENYTRISWVSVDAVGEEMTLRTCTLDGAYELWMVPGPYLVMFSLPTYETKALRLQIPDGSDVQMDLQLLPFGMELQSYVSSLRFSVTDAFEVGLMPSISRHVARISAA